MGALAVFVFVFVCLFVVAQHWFHAIPSQSPSRRRTILPISIVDRLAFSRLVTSKLFEIAWMLQK